EGIPRPAFAAAHQAPPGRLACRRVLCHEPRGSSGAARPRRGGNPRCRDRILSPGQVTVGLCRSAACGLADRENRCTNQGREGGSLRERLTHLYESVGQRDLVEIAILSLCIYTCLRFLGKMRGSGMVRGLGLIVIGLFLVAQVTIASLDLTELACVLDASLTT